MNASDIMSLMPAATGDSDEAARLMPMLVEIQTKLNGLEGMYVV